MILVVRIRTTCLKFQDRSNEKECWELCLIPVFFYCSFSFLVFFPKTLYEYPAITMFVSYLAVLHYLDSETKRNAIYWENMLQKSYIQGLESRHYLVEQAERNLKILHHDIRHYTRMIDSLLEQENYEKIKEVNEHISHIADENKVERYCHNLIVNTILSEMMDKARSLAVQVALEARVPKEIPVNEYEFTLVIANLFDPDTGLPKSKKSGNHGMVMQSIQAFSEKIRGTLGCCIDDGIFQMMLYAKFGGFPQGD